MRLALLLCCVALAHAADYYVSPLGNDDNPGTFEQPWRLTKICRATRSGTPMNALGPGDTVWLRGGKYPTAATVGELPAGAYVGQRAILSTYAMHRWTGSAWSASLGTVNTVAWPSFARIEGAHAFLVRRRYDGRADAIVAYTDPGEHVLSAGYRLPDDSYVWTELPAHSRTCANGRCTARIPVAVGDAWWRIDTGPAWKLAAR